MTTARATPPSIDMTPASSPPVDRRRCVCSPASASIGSRAQSTGGRGGRCSVILQGSARRAASAAGAAGAVPGGGSATRRRVPPIVTTEAVDEQGTLPASWVNAVPSVCPPGEMSSTAWCNSTSGSSRRTEHAADRPIRWRPAGRSKTSPAAGPASTVTRSWASWPSLLAWWSRSARQWTRVERNDSRLPLTMPARSSRARRSTGVPSTSTTARRGRPRTSASSPTVWV